MVVWYEMRFMQSVSSIIIVIHWQIFHNYYSWEDWWYYANKYFYMWDKGIAFRVLRNKSHDQRYISCAIDAIMYRFHVSYI